jgi:xanthine dehydrogenase iron-sulfur cluster and FAD-binding subunit A
VEPLTAYAELVTGGEVAAVARGVLDGGWLGVLDVTIALDGRAATEPEAALVGALVRWAAARGAVRAYKEGAVPLPGFRTAYEYRYRMATNSPARVPT